MKPVSRTAFYCTGVRALDARRPNPACGDQYAERFMDEEAWRVFEPFRSFTGPNLSNATRHRIIDDLLRERLAARPGLLVVILGAGFDSRAFRLRGGRWLEVDEPQVFAWKEPRLPQTGCPNALTRLPMDFAVDSLADRLSPFAGSGAVIVIEGVLYYLEESAIRQMLRTLGAAFPSAEILCDVMTREFFERYGRGIHQKIGGLGASFDLSWPPIETIFQQEGYRETRLISIPERAADLGQMPWPMKMFTRLARRFRNGYSIRVFAPR
jgi:methyltransferase (TIGR00027 family)